MRTTCGSSWDCLLKLMDIFHSEQFFKSSSKASAKESCNNLFMELPRRFLNIKDQWSVMTSNNLTRLNCSFKKVNGCLDMVSRQSCCWWRCKQTFAYSNRIAAAAKSLQSCPTLCDHIDGSPPGSSILGILHARILEWDAISFSNACMHAKLLQSCLTLCDPVDSSPPGSSVHRIFQARILEWIAISFSRLSSYKGTNLIQEDSTLKT